MVLGIVQREHDVNSRAVTIARDQDRNVSEVVSGMLGFDASIARRPGKTGPVATARFRDRNQVRLDNAVQVLGLVQ